MGKLLCTSSGIFNLDNMLALQVRGGNELRLYSPSANNQGFDYLSVKCTPKQYTEIVMQLQKGKDVIAVD